MYFLLTAFFLHISISTTLPASLSAGCPLPGKGKNKDSGQNSVPQAHQGDTRMEAPFLGKLLSTLTVLWNSAVLSALSSQGEGKGTGPPGRLGSLSLSSARAWRESLNLKPIVLQDEMSTPPVEAVRMEAVLLQLQTGGSEGQEWTL